MSREMTPEEVTMLRQIYENTPLMAFSIYTNFQATAIHDLGDNIKAAVRATVLPSGAHDAATVMRAYNLFWFWILGAYETLRTMAQHPDCFDLVVGARTKDLKAKLARLRMPFAKQELRDNGGPIYAENSMVSSRDGSFQFEVGGEIFDAVSLIDEVDDFFRGIRLPQILRALPTRRQDRESQSTSTIA